ncbi:MAG: hypothetical protein HC855_04645 [Rhizobiales bacterium]|nr:hypothetical protein [Hyphomicrobiales bacterium]
MIAFFVTVPPPKWLQTPCDAYAANFALALVFPAMIILAVIGARPPATGLARFMLIASRGLDPCPSLLPSIRSASKAPSRA